MPSFSDLRGMIDGAANSTALEKIGEEIRNASDHMEPNQVALLASAYNERSKLLSNTKSTSKGNGEDLDEDGGFKLVDDSDFSEPEEESVMTKLGEWEKRFSGVNYLETLRIEGLAGQLATSSFRSVAWKLFLKVIPPDQDQWISELQSGREKYAQTIVELVVDPHAVPDGEVDLSKHNPLALDDDAPWQKHFADAEFKKLIDQDVKRTFPEIEFFRNDQVQEDLLNILFCYSRLFPELSYKQGMHELLAFIYMVVYEDKCDSSDPEFANYPEQMKVVLDAKYVAHDAFLMFSKIMDVATSWFMQNKSKPRRGKKKISPVDQTPFQGPASESASSEILIKLDRIHKVLLKNYDPELFHRLQMLDIASSVYGLRWIRVLFAREFTIKQTLRLWDALLADDDKLELVDYFFVAMLCYCKNTFVTKDSMECMRLVMSPFPVPDDMDTINAIVEFALHIRDPKKYPKPALWTVPPTSSPSKPTASGPVRSMPARSSATPVNRSPSRTPRKDSDPRYAEGNLSKMGVNLPGALSSLWSTAKGEIGRAYRRDATSQPEREEPSVKATGQQQHQQQQQRSPSNPANNGRAKYLEEEVTRLRKENDTLSAMNKYYGEKLSSHINKLQEELLVTDRLPSDDVIFVALAGMKEVKNILLGHVQPTVGVEMPQVNSKGSESDTASAKDSSLNFEYKHSDGEWKAYDTAAQEMLAEISRAGQGAAKLLLDGITHTIDLVGMRHINETTNEETPIRRASKVISDQPHQAADISDV
eukprot:m.239350 g.239350  ORF g.239350 m.239350 type:complete len:762 (-) comp16067_c0_seq1:7335-9620(-)